MKRRARAFLLFVAILLIVAPANHLRADDRPEAYRQQALNEIEAYRRAVKLKPDDAQAWFKLGLLYNTLGPKEDAVEAFQQVIKLEPENAAAWHNLGIA